MFVLWPHGKKNELERVSLTSKMGPKMYLVKLNEPNLNPILGRFGPLGSTFGMKVCRGSDFADLLNRNMISCFQGMS